MEYLTPSISDKHRFSIDIIIGLTHNSAVRDLIRFPTTLGIVFKNLKHPEEFKVRYFIRTKSCLEQDTVYFGRISTVRFTSNFSSFNLNLLALFGLVITNYMFIKKLINNS